MITRRGFVTSSLAVAATGAMPSETKAVAQQTSIKSNQKISGAGPGNTAHRLVMAKANKFTLWRACVVVV